MNEGYNSTSGRLRLYQVFSTVAFSDSIQRLTVGYQSLGNEIPEMRNLLKNYYRNYSFTSEYAFMGINIMYLRKIAR